ncbi:MAG: YjjG family noncanonical pyrimidine nucleotidase [Cytophagales bacterium]|nr:YjjG family noncanonical pyrimidine nucleotidase [Cytophagales bacterium]MDW8384787.1 YjjG family noncanonical pyrimidine nucleotidase [Flammeovirgaceae bacterium]
MEHLFFDLDHTLWDFERCATETLEELYIEFRLHRFHFSLEEFQRSFKRINARLWDLYNRNQINKEYIQKERFALVFEALQVSRKEIPSTLQEEYSYRCPRKKYLQSHALDVLKSLYSHYKLHVITNGFEEVQRVKMESSGILPYFDVVVTSQSIEGYKKPDPQIFYFALSRAKTTPQASWMIGDDLLADILGAQNVGMNTIFYNPLRHKHNLRPSVEITSLREIKSLFLKNSC